MYVLRFFFDQYQSVRLVHVMQNVTSFDLYIQLLSLTAASIPAPMCQPASYPEIAAEIILPCISSLLLVAGPLSVKTPANTTVT